MKWICSLLMLVVVSGCAPSAFTDWAAAPGSVLYQDDFSDPESGWPRLSNASGSVEYIPTGSYQMTVNNANYDIWAMSGYSFSAARVEVDGTILDGPQVSRYGLVCRYVDPKNFYFFVVTGDGYQAIGKVRQGVQTLLGGDLMESSLFINTGDGINHLRFDCLGEQLTGYVNQESIASAEDADFRQGDAGLIVGTFDQPGVKVSFDNFIVYKP